MSLKTPVVYAALLIVGAAAGYGYAALQSPSPQTPEAAVGKTPTFATAPVSAPSPDIVARAHGLVLVGTLKAPDAAQSRAWIEAAGNTSASAYAEGADLPEGLRLVAIQDDAVRVADAQGEFVIPRTGGTRAAAEGCAPTAGAAPDASQEGAQSGPKSNIRIPPKPVLHTPRKPRPAPRFKSRHHGIGSNVGTPLDPETVEIPESDAAQDSGEKAP